jgi:adenylate cyclase class IV
MMLIKVKINTSTLEAVCDDPLVTINSIKQLENFIEIEVSKPDEEQTLYNTTPQPWQ